MKTKKLKTKDIKVGELYFLIDANHFVFKLSDKSNEKYFFEDLNKTNIKIEDPNKINIKNKPLFVIDKINWVNGKEMIKILFNNELYMIFPSCLSKHQEG